LFIVLVVSAIFWAVGQQVNPFSVIGAFCTLHEGGAVLGVFPDWEYQESSVELKFGDRLFLFTGGITEAQDSRGEEFGVEKVAAFVKTHMASSAAELNEQLLAQILDIAACLGTVAIVTRWNAAHGSSRSKVLAIPLLH
jgi:Stage II sporulation protein E (SpoIIE)